MKGPGRIPMILRSRINPEVVAYLNGRGIYTAARVVCFQDGLGRLPVPDDYMNPPRRGSRRPWGPASGRYSSITSASRTGPGYSLEANTVSSRHSLKRPGR